MNSKPAIPSQATAPDTTDLIGFVRVRLGTKVAWLIEQNYGGRRLYLNVQPREHHELPKVIGIEAARIIAVEFGAGHADIPLGSAGRSAQIEQACIAGLTTTEIVKSLHCCSRTVYKARARLRRKGLLP